METGLTFEFLEKRVVCSRQNRKEFKKLVSEGNRKQGLDRIEMYDKIMQNGQIGKAEIETLTDIFETSFATEDLKKWKNLLAPEVKKNTKKACITGLILAQPRISLTDEGYFVLRKNQEDQKISYGEKSEEKGKRKTKEEKKERKRKEKGRR